MSEATENYGDLGFGEEAAHEKEKSVSVLEIFLRHILGGALPLGFVLLPYLYPIFITRDNPLSYLTILLSHTSVVAVQWVVGFVIAVELLQHPNTTLQRRAVAVGYLYGIALYLLYTLMLGGGLFVFLLRAGALLP